MSNLVHPLSIPADSFEERYRQVKEFLDGWGIQLRQPNDRTSVDSESVTRGCPKSLLEFYNLASRYQAPSNSYFIWQGLHSTSILDWNQTNFVPFYCNGLLSNFYGIRVNDWLLEDPPVVTFGNDLVAPTISWFAKMMLFGDCLMPDARYFHQAIKKTDLNDWRDAYVNAGMTQIEFPPECCLEPNEPSLFFASDQAIGMVSTTYVCLTIREGQLLEEYGNLIAQGLDQADDDRFGMTFG